jgi:hypothetical protein
MNQSRPDLRILGYWQSLCFTDLIRPCRYEMMQVGIKRYKHSLIEKDAILKIFCKNFKSKDEIHSFFNQGIEKIKPLG